MKKNIIILFCIILYSSLSFAQSIGIGTTTPDASSFLEIKSNTKGMLIPRTSTASRLAIASPAKGLMLYDTTTSSFWFHNGGNWTEITTATSGWGINGNAGTNPAVHFIGTTDNNPLMFRMNNRFAGKIDSAFNNTSLGFGTGSGLRNSAFGYKCLGNNTTGDNNTAIGIEALKFNTSGFQNTGLGGYALSFNTTGLANTGIGFNSLYSNTEGNQNTAAGSFSLLYNTTGYYNTAIGYSALWGNTTAFNNTAIGNRALSTNSTGNNNTAAGYQSLDLNSSGNNNSALGIYSLSKNTTGNFNTAMGSFSLGFNTTGFRNTAFGTDALLFNTTGTDNTATGMDALSGNTTGISNTAVGFNALAANVTGSYNTAIGYNANVNFNDWGNATAIGANALTLAHNIVMIGGPYPGSILIGGYADWFTFSDSRFKVNIQQDVPGLSFINKLNPVTYRVNNDALIRHITQLMPDSSAKHYRQTTSSYAITPEKRLTGFLAQEVEAAAKELGYDFAGVHKPANSSDHYSLAHGSFVVPLVKAVQEQQKIIEEQQKKIDWLMKKVEEQDKHNK